MSAVRLDVQLLRAVAVGAVVLYHFWPERFPGGFIGVDVFFVVSGLLITDHLMREAERTGGIRIVRFWARRARRLLPLAFTVLLATVALLLFVMPASQQRPGMLGVLWSSLYVQNWALAGDSTNYLARDQQPLLTQHFWTLSAEEQFYLVWPLLLVLAMWLGAKLLRDHPMRRRRSALLAIIVVAVASLAHSIIFTATDPGPAYFATTTRAWEFAAGALIAFVPRDFAFLRNGRLPARIAASWAGMLLIVGTTLLLPTGAPFPSATALLPVLGAVLCLMAGDVRRGDPTLLAGVRPLTWIGDISYGVYLWHWPLLIAAPVVLAQPLVAWQKIVLIGIVIGLAALSKRLIEDPVRFAPFFSAPPWRSFVIPLVGTAVVGALVAGSFVVSQVRADEARATLEAAREAGVVTNDPSLPLVPTVSERGSDYGAMYECFDLVYAGLEPCSYGDESSETRIAMVGDSHMAHLIPAVRAAVEERGWHLTTFVGMNCDSMVWDACAGGRDRFAELVDGDYDAVLTSSFRGSYTPIEEVDLFWQELIAADQPIVPVVDVPFHEVPAYECIDASGGDVLAAAACASPRATAIDGQPDRMTTLAQQHGVETLDMTDAFCDDTECATVIQNTIVYQDSPSSHLTASMSTLLGGRIGDEIELRLLAQG
ncbi:acyltransferase family protein [Agrococcus beijingensis]|uniref:acyltransferase family protein n=1 Tax=Agrococcus beijingensis TaxID=3068634 RepID=UPI0027410CD6|nr:acyltransferase family protein [Agrococcus sp. REN33]